MINDFEHKGLQAFFETGSKAGSQPHHATRLRLQLAALNQAKKADDGYTQLAPACVARKTIRTLVSDRQWKLAIDVSVQAWRRAPG